jgi:hypothetical protein
VFRVDVDLSGFKRLTQASLQRLAEENAETVDMALDMAHRQAEAYHTHTNRTGHLVASIRVHRARWSRTNAEGELVNSAYYALFVEFGTKRHWIYPRNYSSPGGATITTGRNAGQRAPGQTAGAGRGSFLRFFVDGQEVFARAVDHPGNRPFPFLVPAAQSCEVFMRVRTEKVVAAAIASLWK